MNDTQDFDAEDHDFVYYADDQMHSPFGEPQLAVAHLSYHENSMGDDDLAEMEQEFDANRLPIPEIEVWPAHLPIDWPWGVPAIDAVTFSPVHDDDEIVGSPLEDMTHWHIQSYPDTCAVVAQEYILDSVLPYDVTEDELVRHAVSSGWYFPGGGTPALQVGNLLEMHGIAVAREENASFEHLTDALQNGQKVLVGVDGDELISSGIDPVRDDWIGDGYAIPGQDANHVVQVIGVDVTDPHNPMVILNDPGHANGCGMMVSVDKFMNAWQDSGHYLVHTTNLADAQSAFSTQTPYQPLFAGYYNSDGTYHYTSDNTDRDPETGAIVRRW